MFTPFTPPVPYPILQDMFLKGDMETKGELIAHLAASMRLFSWRNQLLFADESTDTFEARRMSDVDLGRRLYAADLIAFNGAQGQRIEPKSASYALAGAIVNHNIGRLPKIGSVVRTPCYIAEHDQTRYLRATPGFNHDGNILCLPGSEPFGSKPGTHHLRSLFSAVPFAHSYDYGNLTAYLVAMLFRPALEDFPFLLVDANRKGVGKTRAARALNYIINGEDEKRITWSGNEERTEFSLASFCGTPGPTVVLIDNVRAKRGQSNQIRSQAISTACHGHITSLSPKHRSAQPLFDPVIMFTMNSAILEHDLADKAIVVRIDAPGAGPFYPKVDPYNYARENRRAILSEIVHLAQSLAPSDPSNAASRFGAFDGLVQQIGAQLDLEVDVGRGIAKGTSLAVVEARELYLHCREQYDTMEVELDQFISAIEARRVDLEELPRVIHDTRRLAKDRRLDAMVEWLKQNVLGMDYDGRRLELVDGKLIERS